MSRRYCNQCCKDISHTKNRFCAHCGTYNNDDEILYKYLIYGQAIKKRICFSKSWVYVNITLLLLIFCVLVFGSSTSVGAILLLIFLVFTLVISFITMTVTALFSWIKEKIKDV